MGSKRRVWKFQKIFRDRNENWPQIETGLESWSQLETEFGDQSLSWSLIETQSFGPVADVRLLFESAFLILEIFCDRNKIWSQIETNRESWSQLETECGDQ